MASVVSSNDSLESILQKFLLPQDLNFTHLLNYGHSQIRELVFTLETEMLAKTENITLQGYSTVQFSNPQNPKGNDDTRPKKRTRVALFQNAIPTTTTHVSISEQKGKLHELGRKAVELAGQCGANIFCFQELWNMPMGFCTQKKLPWVEFAEDVTSGSTTVMVQSLAKKHNMVIISPILERDENDILWNTAVVIDCDGEVLGKARKVHIPLSGKFSECSYYNGSGSGIPVFHTKYGKLGLNICYDRHHPQNWFVHSLNGAQIVFNPCATVQSFSESLWPIEARSAAASNGYFVCAINRVGKETFQFEGKEEIGGPFFGSSYVACPDGKRTPGLPIDRNGILIADLNLEMCTKSVPKDDIGYYIEVISPAAG